MAMRSIWLASLLLMACFACSKKDDPRALLAGEDSKVWRPVKETTASGDKDRLSKEERNDVIKFFANGKFNIDTQTDNSTGRWEYKGTTLSMRFDNNNFTESFEVTEISDDKLKLKAADGSVMVMEAD